MSDILGVSGIFPINQYQVDFRWLFQPLVTPEFGSNKFPPPISFDDDDDDDEAELNDEWIDLGSRKCPLFVSNQQRPWPQ